MSFDTVKQLQTLSKVMKNQFVTYPVSTAIIFGITGGKGLEYIDLSHIRSNMMSIHDDYIDLPVDNGYVSDISYTDENGRVKTEHYVDAY